MSRTPGRVAQAKRDRGGEAFERAAECVAVPGSGLRALEVGGEHVEPPLPASRFQVHPPNEVLAGKHRKTVVPVAAPTRRLVDLDSLLEVEQALHPRPVPEQWIEGGQQNAAVAARPEAFELGQTFQVFDPDPAGAHLPRSAKRTGKDPAGLLQALQRSADPVAALHQAPGRGQGAGGGPAMTGQGAQQQGVEGRLGAHAPGQNLGRNDPLDEIEAALKAAPLADRQAPREPERLGHAASELEVPPAGPAVAFEVEGAQRPFALDAFHDGPRHPAMLAQHVAPPGVHLVLLPPPLEARIEGEGQPARFMAPVLEERCSGCKQRLPKRGVETVQPGSEHDAVSAGPAHRNGVELKVAEVLDDPVAAFPHLAVACARAIGEAEAARRKQAGAGESEPPCLRGADGLGRQGHVRTNGLLRSQEHVTRGDCSETTRPRPGAPPVPDNGTKDGQPGQPPRPSLRSARPAARHMIRLHSRTVTRLPRRAVAAELVMPVVAIHAESRRITVPTPRGHPACLHRLGATMETTLERLRERAEEVVRRAPAVEAVVLFGSRARGTAGPGSDWDIALIGKSGKPPEVAYRLLGELPGVRLLGFRVGEIERHKDTAGALEAALARQGVALAGAWQRPACRKEALSMDVVRMRANLDNATDAVTRAVMAGIDHLHARGRKRSDWTPVTTGSADAAEHVAKAVLTGYGLSPREVHFLDALAEQLANAYRGRNDPRQAEWAERVRAMNGTTRTRRLRDADYRRFVAPPAEPLERSVERTGQAQRAQILWLQEMVERWPEHTEEIMDAVREIADKDGGLSGWRASYANKTVTADERTRATIARLEESTAEWIGSAEALLAGLEGGGAPPSESAES